MRDLLLVFYVYAVGIDFLEVNPHSVIDGISTLPNPKRIIRTGSGMIAGQLANRAGGLVMGQGFNGYPSWGITFGAQVPAHAFHVLAPDYGYYLATRGKSDNQDVKGFCAWFLATVWKWEELLKSMVQFRDQSAGEDSLS